MGMLVCLFVGLPRLVPKLHTPWVPNQSVRCRECVMIMVGDKDRGPHSFKSDIVAAAFLAVEAHGFPL